LALSLDILSVSIPIFRYDYHDKLLDHDNLAYEDNVLMIAIGLTNNAKDRFEIIMKENII